jgi:hypothetical protein
MRYLIHPTKLKPELIIGCNVLFNYLLILGWNH